jgi:hypothetical protein
LVVVSVGILRVPLRFTAPEMLTALADRLAASQAKFPSPSTKVRGAFFICVAPVLGSDDERNIKPIVKFLYK